MKITRRKAVLTLAAIVGKSGHAADSGKFRLAVCNETFQGWSFRQACKGALETGYTGIELAPFTLADNPVTLPPAQRSEYRRIMNGEGVQYVGFHSLFTKPDGLHLTIPDAAVRKRSWEFFRKLVDLAGDLGEGCVMVLGSSKQRDAINGATVEEATRRIRDGLVELAPHAEQRKVFILVETLAPHLSNVLTSLDQTIALVREVNSPAVQSMFDTHNAVSEKRPHDELIIEYAKYIRHFHINEMDGGRPGSGRYDFSIPLRALKKINYQGWVSLELFKFKPSGEQLARESAKFIRAVEAKIDGAPG